jgi:hypothetical protein
MGSHHLLFCVVLLLPSTLACAPSAPAKQPLAAAPATAAGRPAAAAPSTPPEQPAANPDALPADLDVTPLEPYSLTAASAGGAYPLRLPLPKRDRAREAALRDREAAFRADFGADFELSEASFEPSIAATLRPRPDAKNAVIIDESKPLPTTSDVTGKLRMPAFVPFADRLARHCEVPRDARWSAVEVRMSGDLIFSPIYFFRRVALTDPWGLRTYEVSAQRFFSRESMASPRWGVACRDNLLMGFPLREWETGAKILDHPAFRIEETATRTTGVVTNGCENAPKGQVCDGHAASFGPTGKPITTKVTRPPVQGEVDVKLELRRRCQRDGVELRLVVLLALRRTSGEAIIELPGSKTAESVQYHWTAKLPVVDALTGEVVESYRSAAAISFPDEPGC